MSTEEFIKVVQEFIESNGYKFKRVSQLIIILRKNSKPDIQIKTKFVED